MQTLKSGLHPLAQLYARHAGPLALIAIVADEPPHERPAESRMAIVVTLFAGDGISSLSTPAQHDGGTTG